MDEESMDRSKTDDEVAKVADAGSQSFLGVSCSSDFAQT